MKTNIATGELEIDRGNSSWEPRHAEMDTYAMKRHSDTGYHITPEHCTGHSLNLEQNKKERSTSKITEQCL